MAILFITLLITNLSLVIWRIYTLLSRARSRKINLQTIYTDSIIILLFILLIITVIYMFDFQWRYTGNPHGL